MRIVFSLSVALGFLIWAVPAFAEVQEEEFPSPREVVATVFSQDIYLDDIEPTPEEVEAHRQRPNQQEFDQWLILMRNRALNKRIWTLLEARYFQKKGLEVPDDEIRLAYKQIAGATDESMRRIAEQKRQHEEELQSPDLTEERKQQIERFLETTKSIDKTTREDSEHALSSEQEASLDKWQWEMAEGMVRSLMFNRELYRDYGGVIIWQQAGLEPVEAYRKFLEEHQTKGAFEIYDPGLKEEFWHYYLRRHPFTMSEDDIREYNAKYDTTDPFEKGWWQLAREK